MTAPSPFSAACQEPSSPLASAGQADPAADATLTPRARVLCVDDEPNALTALARTIRGHYEVVTAPSAAAALARIERGEVFDVVISDLRMPGTDGVTFLGEVRQRAPDAVRVLLTGSADLGAAIAAVNEGQVFRFLVKPCGPDVLLNALAAAIEQRRLVTAERVLLEQTVHGCVKALADLLAIAQPTSFGRATRLKRHVQALAEELGLPDRWKVEVAALLSQVGFIVVPTEIAERSQKGRRLSRTERDLVARVSRLAEQLVAPIPRLEDVRAILAHRDVSFASRESGADERRPPVPIGAYLLRLAQDFDALEVQGTPPALALDLLEHRGGEYHPAVLSALRRLVAATAERRTPHVVEMRLADVQTGMTFATEVVAPNGLLLVARGQEVTNSLLARIWSSWYGFATNLMVSMIVAADVQTPPPAPDGQ